VFINWANGESWLLSDCPVAEDALRLLVPVGVVLLVKPILFIAVLRTDCRSGLERLIDPMLVLSAVFEATIDENKNAADYLPAILAYFW
jgi:hypothetical protein